MFRVAQHSAGRRVPRVLFFCLYLHHQIFLVQLKQGMEHKEYSVKQMIGHQIGITANALRKVFTARITKNEDDISPEQLAVLVRLSSGRGFSQSEIADYLLKDDATITRVLDILEKKKLAVRKKAEYDRRANIASITPKGRETVERLFPVVEEINEELLEGIEPGMVDVLFKVLHKLRDNALTR